MTDARITQSVAICGVKLSAPTRITQSVAIAGVINSGPARVTQTAAVVGVILNPPVRITQSVAIVGVRTERPGCLTQEADCWRIERLDGTVYTFTSHDRNLTFNGETYESCGSLSASALQLSAELGSTDNIDFAGIMYEGGVSELDIWSDKFAGAEVQVWRVPWTGSGSPVLLAAGTVGSRTFGDTEYKFEIVTAGQRLAQQPIISTVTPTCRFKLGDARCTVDVSALAVTGTVTGLATVNLFTGARRRTFADSARAGDATGKFTLGKLTWTGGNNAGISVDVKSYTPGVFILEQPMPIPIALADTYSVTPGCNLTAETCKDVFANKINFGGFEFVKGYDDLNRTPEQDI